LAEIKAVLFDLHGTLAYMENPVSVEKISEHLFGRGYEVSPQQLRASWMFVAFVDYPKYGYRNWHSYFSRIFWRLKVKVDKETLDDIVKLLKSNLYRLYPDAAEAVMKAKKHGYKTAVVTTVAYFQFKRAVKPIKRYLDFIMTGYEARCDKTNPKMYRKVLETLKVKPDEAVMIGDNLQVDILLPKQLGIHTILLDRKGQTPTCQAANAVANNLPEALEIISKFQNRQKSQLSDNKIFSL
jgi:putative hydrolase of the HAD superfamily